MKVIREEQILKFSMNQIIEYLLNEDDTLSKCIAMRLEELYSEQLDEISILQDRIEDLEFM